MLAPHVGAGVAARWGGSRAGAIEDRPTRAATWECRALLGARKGKWEFRFRSATYKDGTTRAQGIGREQPGRLVPVRRVPQVLAQLEGILESHHPGRRGRGNWAARTQATVDGGEWFWSDRSTRLVRQEEVVNDCRSEAKSKGSQKRLFEGGAETQNETRSERQTGPTQQREARAPLEADTRRAEA